MPCRRVTEDMYSGSGFTAESETPVDDRPRGTKMATSDEYTRILDRIAADSYTTRDLERLRHMITVRGNRNVVQFGRYNVRLEEGRNIHIGDRIYRGVEAEMIRDVLADALENGPMGTQIGRGTLRGFSGFVSTVGVLITLLGMGMFFYGLLTSMASPDVSSFPPPVLLSGFAIAFVGIAVAGLGQVIRGWERPRRGR